MNLSEFGAIFKAARIQAEKTQQEVADLTGIARARISAFENGTLPELGMVKVLGLFEAVGLQLLARPVGHGRTLDDLVAEQYEGTGVIPAKPLIDPFARSRKRVRHAHAVNQERRGFLTSMATGKDDEQ